MINKKVFLGKYKTVQEKEGSITVNATSKVKARHKMLVALKRELVWLKIQRL